MYDIDDIVNCCLTICDRGMRESRYHSGGYRMLTCTRVVGEYYY